MTGRRIWVQVSEAAGSAILITPSHSLRPSHALIASIAPLFLHLCPSAQLSVDTSSNILSHAWVWWGGGWGERAAVITGVWKATPGVKQSQAALYHPAQVLPPSHLSQAISPTPLTTGHYSQLTSHKMRDPFPPHTFPSSPSLPLLPDQCLVDGRWHRANSITGLLNLPFSFPDLPGPLCTSQRPISSTATPNLHPWLFLWKCEYCSNGLK